MIVVTGGAGFIGSCLVAALEARGVPEIVVVDRLGSESKWRNLAKRELADLVAPERLPEILRRHRRRIDAVVHLGAVSATTEADADLIVETNFRLTMALWEWCTRARSRLIYASSAATYGDGSAGFEDSAEPAALARLRPLNAYGWSKHLTDRRILRLVAEGAPRPAQWAALKFFNVYGPNEYHKGGQQSVVVQVHRQIRAQGVAWLFRSERDDVPDGGQLRDFVWVDDVVGVILWLLDHPGTSGLFNVGSGRARSFNDLAAAAFAALGQAPRIEYVEMPVQLQGRYQYFTEATLHRLRAAGCPFQPTPLEEGVRRYVQDHLEADDPYR
ncbi:MAG TPA: ADP-glyceromanno-heptose 6-epimerase [Geminicoccaceae bacterium]|nr:ADP-glyceromanno-heptose 6-epimerase [Geminicoccaceae bacterium]